MINTIVYKDTPCIVLKENFFTKKIIFKNETIIIYDYKNLKMIIRDISKQYAREVTSLITYENNKDIKNMHKDFPVKIIIENRYRPNANKEIYNIQYRNKCIYPNDYTIDFSKLVTKENFIKNLEVSTIDIVDTLFIDINNINEEDHVFLQY